GTAWNCRVVRSGCSAAGAGDQQRKSNNRIGGNRHPETPPRNLETPQVPEHATQAPRRTAAPDPDLESRWPPMPFPEEDRTILFHGPHPSGIERKLGLSILRLGKGKARPPYWRSMTKKDTYALNF